MSEQKWIQMRVESAVISDDGKFMEVKFKDSTSTVTQHTVRINADSWFKGWFAEFKLADFERALTEAVNILQGRR